MNHSSMQDLKRYGMKLAHGQSWQLTATGYLKPWLEKLASILELEPCSPNGSPQLIFSPRTADWKELKKLISDFMPSKKGILSQKKWNVHDFYWIKLWFHHDQPEVICEIEDDENPELNLLKLWFSIYPVYKRVLDSGGLPFHAALVERKGAGVLLAAPGNGGKSTCCRRLPSSWHALCDDESLIVQNDQRQYAVHPFPTWSQCLGQASEQSWKIEQHLPLSVIFFLQKAEINDVIPIGEGEKAMYIFQSAMQVFWRNWHHLDRNDAMILKKILFENACALAKIIPAFILNVSLKGRFWEKIEKYLDSGNLEKNPKNILLQCT